MVQTDMKPLEFGWRLIGAALVPFAMISGYLFFTRWPSYQFTTFSDYAGLAVSVLAGAVFVAILPLRPLQRLLSLVCYVPLLTILLVYYTFWIIALFFHDGL